jgi:hypothetical protein
MEILRALFKRTSFALAVTAFGLAAVPATLSAQAAQPTGQAASNISVDCDRFADGQHEVPIVVVTKPIPGTILPAGPVIIQGAALDCHADSGTGISRVAVFLGQRDAGGLHLGDAVLRGPNPIQVLPADQYALVGWTLDAPAPLKAGQVNELYVYARSEVTNVETVVVVPVMGGAGAGAIGTTPPIPTAEPAAAPGGAEGGTQDGDPANTPANNIPTDLAELPPQPDEEAAAVETTPGSGEGPVAPADEPPAE